MFTWIFSLYSCSSENEPKHLNYFLVWMTIHPTPDSGGGPWWMTVNFMCFPDRNVPCRTWISSNLSYPLFPVGWCHFLSVVVVKYTITCFLSWSCLQYPGSSPIISIHNPRGLSDDKLSRWKQSLVTWDVNVDTFHTLLFWWLKLSNEFVVNL